jgi:hypothetical protein
MGTCFWEPSVGSDLNLCCSLYSLGLRRSIFMPRLEMAGGAQFMAYVWSHKVSNHSMSQTSLDQFIDLDRVTNFYSL